MEKENKRKENKENNSKMENLSQKIGGLVNKIVLIMIGALENFPKSRQSKSRNSNEGNQGFWILLV